MENDGCEHYDQILTVMEACDSVTHFAKQADFEKREQGLVPMLCFMPDMLAPNSINIICQKSYLGILEKP
jgi:hypothetical protein